MDHSFDTSYMTMAPTTIAHPPTHIKMEDLQVPFDAYSPQEESSSPSEQTNTPAPSAETKTVKKRKSWGQVLPEPTTALPPRKRAKTADEKEQRRIERVKRNRLAAHNSRERKRQEYEHIQSEKDQMEADLQAFQRKMALMEAELKFYRAKYPGEAPEPVFDLASSPTIESLDTVCPMQTSTSFPSPISMDSMDSPREDSCQPETPASSFEASPDFDSTQYPAAILCDLPCQSISGTASPSLAAISYLTLFNLTLQSMRSPPPSTPSSTLTSSRNATPPSPLWNPLLAWLILLSTSSAQPSSATAPTYSLTMVFLTALMQSTLICRVPLAQLMYATRLSQQMSSVDAVLRPNERLTRAGSGEGVLRSRLTRSRKLRHSGRRRGLRSLKRDVKRSMGSLERQNTGCGFTRRRMES